MKNRLIIIFVAALAMILALTGCNKTVLTGESSEDMKSYVVTADKAKREDFVMGGGLEVEEGDSVRIQADLEGDSIIDVSLIPMIEGEDASAEDIENLDSATATMTMHASGTDMQEATVPVGDYYVSVKVASKKATGTVTVTVESGSSQIANPWSEAASSAEAAEGAGIDGFDVPVGSEISLGALDTITYRYMEGIAEADVEFPAVQVTIRKGLASAGENGDISGDYNTYANEWTQNIKGLEVTCYGNREGEATKTIWTSGDYSYSINALGLGGDTDFGLSADDLSSLINGIQ